MKQRCISSFTFLLKPAVSAFTTFSVVRLHHNAGLVTSRCVTVN